jgi:hypothetical protein
MVNLRPVTESIDLLGKRPGGDIGNVRTRHAEGTVWSIRKIAVMDLERVEWKVAHVVLRESTGTMSANQTQVTGMCRVISYIGDEYDA